jgi:hypothetical protein
LERGTWRIALLPTVAFALPNDYLEFKRRFEKLPNKGTLP